MAAEIERNVRWVLTFADKTPQVAIQAATGVPSRDGQRIDVSVANIGWMATAAKPVRVRLELVNAELVSGDAVVSLGVLPGTGAGRIESRAVTWTVRVGDNTRAASATIVVESEKAGTVRRTLKLSSF